MKDAILTTHAPAPIGPYSQAIRAGNNLYISGQIAIHPPSGDLILTNIEEETHQVLKNLGEILKAAGLGYEHVVSCTVYISDMSMFSRINTIYALYFTDSTPPARATVAVSGLPKNVNVEIGAIAQFPA